MPQEVGAFKVGDMVRLPENEPDAPVPKLLRGRYARVRGIALNNGKLRELAVYTWHEAPVRHLVDLLLHYEWLEAVPPDDAARVDYMWQHITQIPDSEGPARRLADTYHALREWQDKILKQNLGKTVWYCDSAEDVLRYTHKDPKELSDEEIQSLYQTWAHFATAAANVHDAALQHIRP